jgi:RNA polymerase sigma-70 factor (ECF subfamily)
VRYDLENEPMFAIPFMEPAVQEAEALGLDADAFRDFYEEALPRVYGYFLHRCGGAVPVAEDLTQETFLAAVGELKRGRRVEAPIPWLYGIARHKLLDHYRRQERSERLAARLEPEADEPAGGGERERTVAALAAVPAAQRAALVLRHVDGFSVPEVAAMLSRSVEAAESLLARGRVSFKRAYLEAAQ